MDMIRSMQEHHPLKRRIKCFIFYNLAIKCLTSGRHQLNPAKEYYGHQYDQMIPTLTLNQPRKGGAVGALS
eukprot:CCRYP_007999-RA/>CCRYP_007999-RA protein AED:0.29 eAED:0.33 QI:1934/0/0.5/1/0/0/2/0/70